jgi:hypothetical protein
MGQDYLLPLLNLHRNKFEHRQAINLHDLTYQIITPIVKP